MRARQKLFRGRVGLEAQPTEMGAGRDRDLEIAPTSGTKWFMEYGGTVEMEFDLAHFFGEIGT